MVPAGRGKREGDDEVTESVGEAGERGGGQ